MIKAHFEYETLSYKAPVPVRGKLLNANRFLKVTLLEKTYFLSVLPHFHQSTLEEVAFKLEAFFNHYTLNFNQFDLEKRFFNLVPQDSFLDSFSGEMLYHAETLLLGLLKTTFPEKFTSQEILINTLYSDKRPLDFYQNSECIKVKIRPEGAQETCLLLQKLHEQNPNALFRLDGNRRFELSELLYFDQFLNKYLKENAYKKIDYVEEPLKNFYESSIFEKKSLLNIAIDESFTSSMMNGSLFNIAVIKPSFTGLSPIFFWLRLRQEKRAIISSSFEHPTILVHLYELAKLRSSEFHGLENFL